MGGLLKGKGISVLLAVSGEEVEREDITDASRCKNTIEEVLANSGVKTDTLYLKKTDFVNFSALSDKILDFRADCVFNLFEGFSQDAGKEHEFVRILENRGVVFTGNRSYALEACLNKARVKEILKASGIPVPAGIFVKSINDLAAAGLRLPVFIKPAAEDASLGIDSESLVADRGVLKGVVNRKLEQFPQGLIVEEFISGKEYNVAVLGNYPYEVAGISVIDYSRFTGFPRFLTYQAKWDSGSEVFNAIVPKIDDSLNVEKQREIIDFTARSGMALKCGSYFRVDLREENGRLFILDVNPNPDINIDSGFIKQCRYKGYNYDDVIARIIFDSGLRRLIS